MAIHAFSGNNDDAELKRNTNYFRQFKIDTRLGQYPFEHLVAHIRVEEKHLIETDYAQIKRSYCPQQEAAEKKINKLIELFEMRDSRFEFITPISKRVDDFDRLFLTLQHIKCVFFPCLVEDFANEKTAFAPTFDLWRLVYLMLLEKQNKFEEIEIIEEFARARQPARDHLVNSRFIKVCTLRDLNPFANKYIAYLRNQSLANEKSNSLNILLVSLVVWENWLNSHLSMSNFPQLKEFVESVLVNFVVLRMKYSGLANGDPALREIVRIYDEFCFGFDSDSGVDMDKFFARDLKLVHRLNEFQAIYYTFGAVSKLLNASPGDFKSPHTFFNAYFITSLVQAKADASDLNNNSEKPKNSLDNLRGLIDSCEVTSSLLSSLRVKYNACKELLDVGDDLAKRLSTLGI